MFTRCPALRLAFDTWLLLGSATASAQSRSNDNAVTAAEDAFGYSVGRESLGIYSADNVRGFSPSAAGNVRIDGLYFDPVVSLSGLVTESESIKVGLSAQGYPFPAPSGIVDQRVRRPADSLGASLLANADTRSSIGAELDLSLPIVSGLALGLGLNPGRWHFADGTTSSYHSEALIGRWTPLAGVEVLPFWSSFTDIDNLSSPSYLPAGEFVPPQPRPGYFPGPKWEGINRTQMNLGMLASAKLSPEWQLRIGAFRSLQHLRNGFTYLMADVQPDGIASHQIFADPPLNKAGASGEVRLTRRITDGPRLHLIHLSVRGRSSHRAYGGEDEIELGTFPINQNVDSQLPDFQFGATTHDRLRQWLYGLAYDGRWKGVGELSFGLSRTLYRKTSVTPDARIVARASPLLYNLTATVFPLRGIALYGGFSRGFEESGSPPASASNRGAALPAILTSQIDAGVRIDLNPKLKATAGLFDLKRPYFGFDAANRFVSIGTTISRGLEFSLAGDLTDTLTLVGGGVLLDARVEAPGHSDVGRRPVGISSRILDLDVNWKLRAISGLSLDAALAEQGPVPATVDNLVSLPARSEVGLGARYNFALGRHRATARMLVSNVLNSLGFSSAGPGAYSPNAGRSTSAYLTVDL